MENHQTYLSIVKTLEPLSLKDQVEVLANTFMQLGLRAILAEGGTVPEKVTPELVIDYVMSDIKQRGDTVGNSLCRQGLVLMNWIEKE